MAKDRNKGVPADSDVLESEGELIIGPATDGMGRVTAMEAIDKKLRKDLLDNYDLIELVNKGRYYTAKAYSKDGRWLNELLIDKQTKSIQVVSKRQEK
ncbi:MAG: hypothetical protein KKE57_00660 [Proteobacteria bacterium]|nr:hypothetical protein [Pseudomonadota bacterium]